MEVLEDELTGLDNMRTMIPDTVVIDRIAVLQQNFPGEAIDSIDAFLRFDIDGKLFGHAMEQKWREAAFFGTEASDAVEDDGHVLFQP